jgi:hypothetical protein
MIRVSATPETKLRPNHESPGMEEPADESIYLIGRPSLRQFLRFVRREAADDLSESALVEEWRTAHEIARALERDEAGFADNPEIRELGPDYEPLLIEFLKDPLVRHGFNAVPTEVGMVELDRLVVYQKHIDMTHVRNLERKLRGTLTREGLFRVCLPYDHPLPPVRWSRRSDDAFVFVSPSNDLRFLGALRLQAHQVVGCPPPGVVVGVVGVTVGFGSNFLNAIYAENRLILNNGSHRAVALRELGITHVPCVIQHIGSRAELNVVAPSEVRRNPDRFLKGPRPSVLKDYFDARLRKTLRVHRRVRQVTVRFETDEAYVPAL